MIKLKKLFQWIQKVKDIGNQNVLVFNNIILHFSLSTFILLFLSLQFQTERPELLPFVADASFREFVAVVLHFTVLNGGGFLVGDRRRGIGRRRFTATRGRRSHRLAGPAPGGVPALRRLYQTPAERREGSVLLVLWSSKRRRS